jgi:hypothetical protein
MKLSKMLKLLHEPKTELIPGVHCSCIACIYEKVQYFCSARPEISVNIVIIADICGCKYSNVLLYFAIIVTLFIHLPTHAGYIKTFKMISPVNVLCSVCFAVEINVLQIKSAAFLNKISLFGSSVFIFCRQMGVWYPVCLFYIVILN